jgi:hypothetical protein
MNENEETTRARCAWINLLAAMRYDAKRKREKFDSEGFRRRDTAIRQVATGFCEVDLGRAYPAQIRNTWLPVWEQMTSENKLLSEIERSDLLLSMQLAFAVNKMTDLQRKAAVERGWVACRENARLAGLTADEALAYEGQFHRVYDGAESGFFPMILAIHAAMEEKEIALFRAQQANTDPVRPRLGQKLKPEQVAFIRGAGHSETKAQIAEKFKAEFGFGVVEKTIQNYRNPKPKQKK